MLGEAARDWLVPLQDRVKLLRAQVELQRNSEIRAGEILLSFGFHQFPVSELPRESGPSLFWLTPGSRIQVLGFWGLGFRIQRVKLEVPASTALFHSWPWL